MRREKTSTMKHPGRSARTSSEPEANRKRTDSDRQRIGEEPARNRRGTGCGQRGANGPKGAPDDEGRRGPASPVGSDADRHLPRRARAGRSARGMQARPPNPSRPAGQTGADRQPNRPDRPNIRPERTATLLSSSPTARTPRAALLTLGVALSGVAQSAAQRTVNPLVESSSLSPGAAETAGHRPIVSTLGNDFKARSLQIPYFDPLGK